MFLRGYRMHIDFANEFQIFRASEKHTVCVINFSPASLSQRSSPFTRAVSPGYCVYRVRVCACVRHCPLSLPKDVAAVAV